jgi:hypothetical protein
MTHECVGALLHEARKGSIDLGIGAGVSGDRADERWLGLDQWEFFRSK